ncbi:hypothetical protein SSSM5_156 [Synechococcus phage S-SSM5]|uniref:DUF6450 domain-containing protein n=1 Tax=Synechococcus phage S-SSM5 TaxID=445685 RepID=E3SKJ6_9CAUD|nr:hypothetical protein SSSM5_156 [Synechococcus phage S-SSM5]ADO97914.1 hypothetical protein SSSM5_156 [Synechococcus phage S-SSM5]
MPEEVKQEEPKKKGIFGKLKEASEDKEEQLAILSTFVRLGILVWSGGILTLAYVDLPKALQFPEQDLDPTFIASVFTGVLATFGVQTAKKSGDGTMKMQQQQQAAAAAGGITKADLERLIEAAKSSGPTQTIRVEQAPLKITTDETYKM